MKTDFQPNEVLRAEDLNANFQECEGKADANHNHVRIKNEQGNDVAYVECLPDKIRIYAEQELEIELGGEIIHVNAGNIKELILPSRMSDGDDASVHFEDGDVRVTGKDFVIDLSDSEGEDILRITESDLVNLARAKRNPDSTPTTNSDNLVTSGGVKVSLDGKADKVALQTTMGEHMGGIPTFTGLDDKTESQVCLIEITMLGGAVKQGGLLIVQNATSVYSQTIIAGTDIYVRIYQGGYWHEWEHRTIPATQVTLPIEISDVTNLQTALNGKLGSGLVKIETTPVAVNTLETGVLYVIDNANGAKLDELITSGDGTVHFHLSSGELTNRTFIIRKYASSSALSPGHYFVEVVGAWG